MSVRQRKGPSPRSAVTSKLPASAEDFASIGVVYDVLPGPVRLAADHLSRRVLHRLATRDV